MELIERFLTNNPCYQANLARADSRYVRFQTEGPKGLMLHSVGCAQPKAEVFCRRWDRADYDNGCVHALIDAETGAVWQTLPWSFRGWHCGGKANDTHLGVELCESAAIRYEGGARFTVLDRQSALADCARTYQAAVELFAFLCRRYGLDPRTSICSHKEAGRAGLASGHVDPEHYWSGLGAPYTMDGFRADVAKALAALPPADGPLYRIQVGAFRNRAYAEDFLRQVQTHFPEAFLKTEAM
ncbi:MAG: N-acetylmuramoyl-L-alanine amidase [Oscillospiraceae bacterium]|nr:N-acetylmuramoyl-L-alanine amidase [Oscillospiraceae bacterium]